MLHVVLREFHHKEFNFVFSTPDAPAPDGGVSSSVPTENSDLDSDDDDSSDDASSFSDSD